MEKPTLKDLELNLASAKAQLDAAYAAHAARGHADRTSGFYRVEINAAGRVSGFTVKPSETPPRFRHLMIDDETLAKHTSRSLVLSAGLLPFRLLSTGPEFGEPTIIIPHLGAQLLDCRFVDPGTQTWWRDKCSPKASAHWADPNWAPSWSGVVHRRPLTEVGEVIEGVARDQLVEGYRIWAKGSVFDLGNLENGFVGLDGKTPYGFRDVRDHRTWILEAPKQRSRPADTKAATTHDPIDDCINQIWTLWEHALPEWFEDHVVKFTGDVSFTGRLSAA